MLLYWAQQRAYFDSYSTDVELTHASAFRQKLYDQGARTFWIHNTGPIGCLPYLLAKHPPKPENVDEAGCVKSYNEVAKEFNRQLKDRISELRTQLHDSLLVYVDIYSLKFSLISESEKYGETHIKHTLFSHEKLPVNRSTLQILHITAPLNPKCLQIYPKYLEHPLIKALDPQNNPVCILSMPSFHMRQYS